MGVSYPPLWNSHIEVDYLNFDEFTDTESDAENSP